MSDDLARRILALLIHRATPWLRRWDSGTHAAPAGYRVMNQPKVQTDVPAEGASPDQNPTGKTPHGIPEELVNEEPDGRPSPDRMATEIAVLKSGMD